MTVLKIAWRNIWRNKNRSIVIMLSVAIGFFCGIMVLAIYKGMMTGRVNTVIKSETGHIQVHHVQFKSDYDPSFIIQNSSRVLKSIHQLKSVFAISKRAVTQGMLSTTTGSSGVQINGIDWQEEKSVSQLDKKILEIQEEKWAKPSGILIGKKLAVKMKLKIGNKLVLTFTDTSSTIVSGAFRVVGIYQSDNAPLDERNVYIKRKELSDLLGIGSGIHEIAILLKSDEQTSDIRSTLQKQYPQNIIESWRDLSPETELMVNTIDVYSYIIIAIILFALSFGIINTMLMAVLERTREIGMMMSLGLNKFKLFLMIILETLFLTLGGVPLGFTSSYLLTWYYNQNGMDWSGMGKEMMSSFGFSTMIYPEFPTASILPILLIVIVTALFSCILPAYSALKLNPVHAMRK